MKHKIEQQIDSILQLENTHRNYYTYFFDNVRWLKQELQNQEFKITIIGEFSAGKSTFINALIGKDVLPHATNETTSTITYIHNVPLGHPKQDKAIIKFNEDKEQDIEVNLKEDGLKNYVTTFSKKYNVAKEIQAVHIYTTFMHTKEKVVLIDTPGLNGMAVGHKELTLKEVKEAHGSIFLFHLRSLTLSNQELIRYACEKQPKILYVLNFIDEIKKSEGETVEGKLEELRMQIKEYLPDAMKDREISCFAISALRALIGRDESIKRVYQTDMKDIEPHERKKLFQDSRIEIFEKALWQDLINNQKQAIFYEAMEDKLQELVGEVLEEVNLSEKVQQAKLDKNAIEQIQIHLEETRAKRSENWETINNLILSKQRELTKLVDKYLYHDLQGVQTVFEQSVGQMDMETFEKALKAQQFTSYIKMQIHKVEEKYESMLSELLQDAYQSAIMRTKSFRPEIKLDAKGEFKLQYTAPKINFGENETVIARKQKEVAELQAKMNVFQTEMNVTQRETAKKEKEIEAQAAKGSKERSELERKLSSLGSRPGATYRTVTKERRVRKNLLGRGWAWLTGGSEYTTETYEVEELDYSKQKQWDSNRQQIMTKIQTIEKQNEALKQQLSQLKAKSQLSQERYKNYETRLKANQKEIEILRQEEEERKKYARREHLRAEKNKVYKKSRENMEKYYNQLEKNIEKMIDKNILHIQKLVKNYYDEVQKQHEMKLRQLLGEKMESGKDERLQAFKVALERVQKGEEIVSSKKVKTKRKVSQKLHK